MKPYATRSPRRRLARGLCLRPRRRASAPPTRCRGAGPGEKGPHRRGLLEVAHHQRPGDFGRRQLGDLRAVVHQHGDGRSETGPASRAPRFEPARRSAERDRRRVLGRLEVDRLSGRSLRRPWRTRTRGAAAATRRAGDDPAVPPSAPAARRRRTRRNPRRRLDRIRRLADTATADPPPPRSRRQRTARAPATPPQPAATPLLRRDRAQGARGAARRRPRRRRASSCATSQPAREVMAGHPGLHVFAELDAPDPAAPAADGRGWRPGPRRRRCADAGGGGAAAAAAARRRRRPGPRGVDVILHNLVTGRDQLLGSVGDIAFNKSGDLLAYTVDAAVKDGNGLFVIDLKTNRFHTLDNDAKAYNRLIWSDDGKALAVLKGATSTRCASATTCCSPSPASRRRSRTSRPRP